MPARGVLCKNTGPFQVPGLFCMCNARGSKRRLMQARRGSGGGQAWRQNAFIQVNINLYCKQSHIIR